MGRSARTFACELGSNGDREMRFDRRMPHAHLGDVAPTLVGRRGVFSFAMKIESPALSAGEFLPRKYAQSGNDINPPLIFSDVPEFTQSLLLIVDDPDAPQGTFTHWLVFNLEADTREIREGETPDGVSQGANTRHENKYTGPNQPAGEHRYFFRLFALDPRLDLQSDVTRGQIATAMAGHVIATAEPMGRYAAGRNAVGISL